MGEHTGEPLHVLPRPKPGSPEAAAVEEAMSEQELGLPEQEKNPIRLGVHCGDGEWGRESMTVLAEFDDMAMAESVAADWMEVTVRSFVEIYGHAPAVTKVRYTIVSDMTLENRA